MRELKTIEEVLDALYNKKDIFVYDGNMVVVCVHWDLELYYPNMTKQVHSLPIRKGYKYFVVED